MNARDAVRKLIEYVGQDPNQHGLIETPDRVLAAWRFWCSGYAEAPGQVLKTFDGEQYDELVFQTGIPFFSTCEHHMVPFWGYAHIAYVPNGRIVGLSKLARLTEIFARRLSVQERLTSQIPDALMEYLNCKGAACVTQARHMCMESRGVQKVGTVTVCSALRGNFKDDPTIRAEFMSLCQTAMNGIKVL